MIGLLLAALGGLSVLVVLLLRLLAQVRRLEEQVALTRAELEPRYAALQELTDRVRAEAR
nr:hypothetical protein [Marinactinospora thermotolerans]